MMPTGDKLKDIIVEIEKIKSQTISKKHTN
jgi:hypothetical protein